ncbi:uncharacterized mitochondrial protein AtMg00860-like [Dioscorea cayenensis subsp. rotundata]|uniref:Uncharacterized mitochondrial protein AtMg00860-like n=1 Tax=Dioscorea cayennensis subsp. rotundata TaxID=55577 RepID=A0AB40AKI3_DIOCR|nr:uncharacterized mitochondrial protein AtMg00860-like [Dioscorea cayenensis subsp. rotundata]
MMWHAVADQDEEVKTKSEDGDAKMAGDGQKAGRPKRDRIPTIFSMFRQHQLFAKLSKCTFECSRIAYLGHTISGEGVTIDSEKVQAIQQWPLPTSVRSLRGFLGLTGYYRRFVQGYATMAAPLTDLLRKNAFVWSKEAANAFQSLKIALTTTPVL